MRLEHSFSKDTLLKIKIKNILSLFSKKLRDFNKKVIKPCLLLLLESLKLLSENLSYALNVLTFIIFTFIH